MGIIFLVIILTIPLVFLPTATLAIDYTFTTIDVPDATTNWGAYGINDSGDIVGTYQDATGRYRGYLYAGGVFTTIDFLNSTYANGINNSGDIVGYGIGPWYHNFLYSNGIFTTIDVPGVGPTTNWGAKGINDLGSIVGSYGDDTGRPGFLYTGGEFTAINVPGAVEWTVPFGINNSGNIAGTFTYSDEPGRHRGFLYAGGNFTLIDGPDADGGTDVNGINDLGEIVGTYYSNPTPSSPSGYYPFLYAEGVFTSIDVSAALPGIYYAGALGINNSGSIVGYYTDATGRHGFVATPILQSVLSVTPSNRNVANKAGTTTFSVSNTGTGTMDWAAAVTSGSSWLKITSGTIGTDTGTISCSFNANKSKSARTGTVQVTATGATGSPMDVTVIQAGKKTK